MTAARHKREFTYPLRCQLAVEISKLRREEIIECEKSHFKLKSPSSGHQQ